MKRISDCCGSQASEDYDFVTNALSSQKRSSKNSNLSTSYVITSTQNTEKSLSRYLEEYGNFPLPDWMTAAIIRDVSNALIQLHSNQVIHRVVSIDKIFLMKNEPSFCLLTSRAHARKINSHKLMESRAEDISLLGNVLFRCLTGHEFGSINPLNTPFTISNEGIILAQKMMARKFSESVQYIINHPFIADNTKMPTARVDDDRQKMVHLKREEEPGRNDSIMFAHKEARLSLIGDVNKSEVAELDSDQPNRNNRNWERWILLLLVASLNFSNTISWISYAPVGNYVNSFYGPETATRLSAVYLLVSVPFGLCGIWLGSVSGVKRSLVMAALPNAFGAMIRAYSHMSHDEYRYYLVICGQTLAAFSYPFIMFLPSKVSDSYFPPSERTLATTIGIMSNPFGILTANFFAPLLVQSSQDIAVLNNSLCVLCVGVLALVFFFSCRGLSNENKSESKEKQYLISFKTCFTNINYIILFVILGGGIGMFNSLYTMMFEMMCPSGYSNQMAGWCAVIMITSGIVGSFVAGVVVDKKKCYKEAMMLLMIVAVTAGTVFIWTTKLQGVEGTIGLLMFAFILGFCGLATYPVGLELALECTYPASPEVSSGLIVLFGQVFSLFFITILKLYSYKIDENDYRLTIEVCRATSEDNKNYPKDYTVAFIIISCVASMFAVLVVFLRPEYKRSDSEKKQTYLASQSIEFERKCFPPIDNQANH
ncbi:hypothetical protein GCK72_014280 [Caenorhabditis remanei]|uniref:Protein kinase domain-containing protein n=1 Tax=Caenorhabditis remanei TaxID=31234 RepID=A0A6A5GTL5_CAERE|nr:hypothetical protein GCK72_014280 [Caenorhabditis remanei]KAF1757823.1 hypothetical protein GCK72_014280 [Caenorhabditis remanei]